MTKEEAIRILDPKTTREALDEIFYWNGFSGKEAVIKAVEEACILAVEALKKSVREGKWVVVSTETDKWVNMCSACGGYLKRGQKQTNYCPNCGAKMF